MNSSIALIGGQTFTEGFEEVHIRLIDLARSMRTNPDDRPVHVVYLTTCASHDGVERVDFLRERAKKNLGSMGVKVSTPRVIDHQSANDTECARIISEADWIYFSGGHPHIGMRILTGSRVLEAVLTAFKRGVLISGSSAGAMILCRHSIVITPDMNAKIENIIKRGEGHSDWLIPPPPIEKCLGLVPRSMCWPHMNQFFSVNWIRSLLPHGHRFIGIDEQTAAVKNTTGRWQVWGRGKVMVGTHHTHHEYPSDTDVTTLSPKGDSFRNRPG